MNNETGFWPTNETTHVDDCSQSPHHRAPCSCGYSAADGLDSPNNYQRHTYNCGVHVAWREGCTCESQEHQDQCMKSGNRYVECDCPTLRHEPARISQWRSHNSRCNVRLELLASLTASCTCTDKTDPWDNELVVDDHRVPEKEDQKTEDTVPQPKRVHQALCLTHNGPAFVCDCDMEDALIEEASRPSAVELIRRAKARDLLKPIKGYGPLS